MLIHHHDYSAQRVFNTYYNNLRNMPNNGYPVNLRKISISNGNLQGVKNGWGGRKVLDLYAKWNTKVATIKLFPDNGQSTEIFKGLYAYIPPLYAWLLIYGFTQFDYQRTSTIVANSLGKCSIDAAPGGTFSTFKTIIETTRTIKAIKRSEIWQDNHCFMPVSSVLDISGDPDYCKDYSNINLVYEGKTPFDAYWGNKQGQNMEHVSFNQDLVQWLLKQIETRTDVSIVGSDVVCATEEYTLDVSTLQTDWHVTSGFTLTTPFYVTPARVSPTTSFSGQTGTLTAFVNGKTVATKVISACTSPCTAWYEITDDCQSCGICVSECPVNAISEVDGKYQIDHLTCVDCGACAEICPVSAISTPCIDDAFNIPVIVGDEQICPYEYFSLSIPYKYADWSVSHGFRITTNPLHAVTARVIGLIEGQTGTLTAMVNGVEIIKHIETACIDINEDQYCIDRDKCINCGMCALVCPVLAIEIIGYYGKYKTNAVCIQCGACLSECPVGAIDICSNIWLSSNNNSNDTTSKAPAQQGNNDHLAQKTKTEDKPVHKVCPKKGKVCNKKSGGCCSGSDTTPKQKTMNIQNNVYFKVSPNPVTGTLIIQKIINTNNLISDKTISYELYNQSSLQLVGKGSFEGDNYQINVSSFANGVYLLRLAIGEHTEVHRIVVEK